MDGDESPLSFSESSPSWNPASPLSDPTPTSVSPMSDEDNAEERKTAPVLFEFPYPALLHVVRVGPMLIPSALSEEEMSWHDDDVVQSTLMKDELCLSGFGANLMAAVARSMATTLCPQRLPCSDRKCSEIRGRFVNPKQAALVTSSETHVALLTLCPMYIPGDTADSAGVRVEELVDYLYHKDPLVAGTGENRVILNVVTNHKIVYVAARSHASIILRKRLLYWIHRFNLRVVSLKEHVACSCHPLSLSMLDNWEEQLCMPFLYFGPKN